MPRGYLADTKPEERSTLRRPLLELKMEVVVEVLHKAYPAELVIGFISHLVAHQRAALSAGADAFISKGEMPERVTEHLRTIVVSVPINDSTWLIGRT